MKLKPKVKIFIHQLIEGVRLLMRTRLYGKRKKQEDQYRRECRDGFIHFLLQKS
jgi:hypothetical protein